MHTNLNGDHTAQYRDLEDRIRFLKTRIEVLEERVIKLLTKRLENLAILGDQDQAELQGLLSNAIEKVEDSQNKIEEYEMRIVKLLEQG